VRRKRCSESARLAAGNSGNDLNPSNSAAAINIFRNLLEYRILVEGPAVVIAIPTLHAGEELYACLRCLDQQVFRKFEVIVINNGERSFRAPAELGFSLRVLTPGSNVGFGEAINAATHSSTAPYIAALNDDTEPDPAWLASLVRDMSAEAKVGMCASRIEILGSGILDSAGMLICFDGSSKQRGQGQIPSMFDRPTEVLFPSGCAALYRRTMLEEIGYFDGDYFLYCEDTDLGLRARWAGWKCRYVPDAKVQHHYSATAGAVSPLKIRYVERNRLWVAIKNFPLALLLIWPLSSMMRYFWQAVFILLSKGAASQYVRSGNSSATAALTVLRAHVETLAALPSLLKKRAAIRRSIGTFDFLKLLSKNRITTRELARS